jgi:hypothetical protein
MSLDMLTKSHQKNPSMHKEGLSQRAWPHVPGEGACNEGPNCIPAHIHIQHTPKKIINLEEQWRGT